MQKVAFYRSIDGLFEDERPSITIQAHGMRFSRHKSLQNVQLRTNSTKSVNNMITDCVKTALSTLNHVYKLIKIILDYINLHKDTKPLT